MREGFGLFLYDRCLQCGRYDWQRLLSNIVCGSRNFFMVYRTLCVRINTFKQCKHVGAFTWICTGTNVPTYKAFYPRKNFKIEFVPPLRNEAYFRKLFLLMLTVVTREILHVLLALPNAEACSENHVTFDLWSFN